MVKALENDSYKIEPLGFLLTTSETTDNLSLKASAIKNAILVFAF